MTEHTAAGQEGNLDLDLAHDLDLVPSGKAPPCGGEAPETGSSDQSSVSDGGENPETHQSGDDYDPDYDSEPKLPPPYEPWWRPGMDVTVTMLEDEAYRLAIEGVIKPIFQRGTEVGERRVRSERLLQFLLITSAFKKYGRREVGPLQAEEEPGRPEFMAKLNAIYGQDEELHRKFTEVFERNNARRHAERLADLERQNRSGSVRGAMPRGEDTETGRRGDAESKAPPCTHGASGAEDTETGGSNQSSVSNEWDVLDFDQFSADVAAARGEDAETGRHVDTESKAPPCTHGASGAGDTETGQGGSDQSAVKSEQSAVKSEQSSVTENAAAGQKGNLTLDHDLNHNLVMSDSAGVAQPGATTKEPPAGTAENQGAPPEHDAAWYSPSARAARITQSMIEHRLRRRRVEM